MARVLIVTRDEANDCWIVTKRIPDCTRITRYYTQVGVLAAIERWVGVVKLRAKKEKI